MVEGSGAWSVAILAGSTATSTSARCRNASASSTDCRRRIELWDRLAELDKQMPTVDGLGLLGSVGLASDLSCGDGSSRWLVGWSSLSVSPWFSSSL